MRKPLGSVLGWQAVAIPFFDAHPEWVGQVHTRAAWIRLFVRWFKLSHNVADLWVDMAKDNLVFQEIKREADPWGRATDKNSPLFKLVDHNRWRTPIKPSDAGKSALEALYGPEPLEQTVHFLHFVSKGRVIVPKDDDANT